MAMMKPGDQFIALNLASGGHLSHGMKLNASAIFFKPDFYELDPQTDRHRRFSPASARRRWN